MIVVWEGVADSGWVFVAVSQPMDVLKARLQKGGEGTSATRLLRKIWREEGHKGVWRGYWLSECIRSCSTFRICADQSRFAPR